LNIWAKFKFISMQRDIDWTVPFFPTINFLMTCKEIEIITDKINFKIRMLKLMPPVLLLTSYVTWSPSVC
jgi:hypothetical protein